MQSFTEWYFASGVARKQGSTSCTTSAVLRELDLCNAAAPRMIARMPLFGDAPAAAKEFYPVLPCRC